jgi:PAS domain S-box-containing protein
MHPLRVLLLVSLVVAIAVAWGFGAALEHAGATRPAVLILSVGAWFVFMVPWLGVSLWALRRASDLDELTDRARKAVDHPQDVTVAPRLYHAELDDLGRAIEELRASTVRQRLSHEEHRAAMDEIVASLGEGLLAVTAHGRVVFANARFVEMFGVSGEVVGRSVLEVIRRQPVLAAVEEALSGTPAVDRITVGIGNQERQIEIRAVPVTSADIAAVALFIDVTTIERLQRVRREFLDDFSHEVRTPLAGIRSATETFESGGLTREQELQLRNVIQRQLARLERLVNDLSELNRIETGDVVLHRSAVDLRSLLSELAEDFQGRVASMRFRVEGESAEADIDAMRAQQIFSNLLDNACKHGGGKGEVLIELDRADDDVLVRVSDEGPGIPEPELERVFHRFYRVDRSRSQPGTGLGLAIAKHLVAAHGGTIRAFNRSGGGASFEVRLPARLHREPGTSPEHHADLT